MLKGIRIVYPTYSAKNTATYLELRQKTVDTLFLVKKSLEDEILPFSCKRC